ncbi:hypothetical protein EYF80_026532 [Liparis tanakae]|uniref:Uncharacterized protein n=1 Tax=Liparis tanakae TaxID=230148 RepID=A0A4Z2HCC8_9TELE|nr:hypothetical protein EYF80_026532 [Liparis tanakae]
MFRMMPVVVTVILTLALASGSGFMDQTLSMQMRFLLLEDFFIFRPELLLQHTHKSRFTTVKSKLGLLIDTSEYASQIQEKSLDST